MVFNMSICLITRRKLLVWRFKKIHIESFYIPARTLELQQQNSEKLKTTQRTTAQKWIAVRDATELEDSHHVLFGNGCGTYYRENNPMCSFIIYVPNCMLTY